MGSEPACRRHGTANQQQNEIGWSGFCAEYTRSGGAPARCRDRRKCSSGMHVAQNASLHPVQRGVFPKTRMCYPVMMDASLFFSPSSRSMIGMPSSTG